jgi:Protein of unknown function (DUF2490)
MSMLKLILSLSLLVVGSGSLHGQQARTHAVNNNAWLMYFGNHRLSERFGVHAEAQWRRNDFFANNQQLLLRTGVDYYLKDNSRITVGYAYIKTYPYGDFAVANAFPEHRLWQQFTTAQQLGKVKLAHRYRLEQRMIGNPTTGEFENGRFENRFRYMAKATVTLTSKWKRPLYLAAYDEVFVNWGKDVAYNIFDQNRLYAALGITLSPKAKLEFGYLYQVILLRTLDITTAQNKIEDNHTIQFGFFHNLDFRRKEQQG